MSDEPKTATGMMMLDHEKMRIEARDRAVAISIGAEMTERYFQPAAILDMNDVRRAITEAAQMAAYTAIQKERELHLGDMATLKAWMEVRAAEAYSTPSKPLEQSAGIQTNVQTTPETRRN
jgi:hypothetical protein